ncbi:MAG: DUF2934 domain-containing protein [Candidatus Competibacteraceae bacterium]|jgi:hypothetical protein|nr:DUF2934 domain-containing protein [Candidatus Competibacteraceae bacterium]
MNAKAKTTAAESASAQNKATPEERNSRIAEIAYLKAEQRGFEAGQEENDWLEAEQEVEQLGDYWLP